MTADLRPLAAVMVADPTPLTLANLRRLSTWCDLLLTEATVTHQGLPRTPLRAAWRDLLGLAPPRLRVFTTDLPVGPTARLHQRNGVLPALVREPADRPVLLLDADELLEEAAVLERIGEGIEEPVRLGLVPLYGAIDRVALSIHCCWKPERARLRREPPRRPYLFIGPVVASVAMLRSRTPSSLRHLTPLHDRERTYGVHITMADSVEVVINKLDTVFHVWDPRIHQPLHLNTMLSAGVHHAGWWIANHREPEAWLRELAVACQLRMAGPPLPLPQLRVLRAWGEARLNHDLPDELVNCLDAYVAERKWDQEDFLGPLDDWLCSRQVENNGYCVKSER